jgi:hypothetical protein
MHSVYSDRWEFHIHVTLLHSSGGDNSGWRCVWESFVWIAISIPRVPPTAAFSTEIAHGRTKIQTQASHHCAKMSIPRILLELCNKQSAIFLGGTIKFLELRESWKERTSKYLQEKKICEAQTGRTLLISLVSCTKWYWSKYWMIWV